MIESRDLFSLGVLDQSYKIVCTTALRVVLPSQLTLVCVSSVLQNNFMKSQLAKGIEQMRYRAVGVARGYGKFVVFTSTLFHCLTAVESPFTTLRQLTLTKLLRICWLKKTTQIWYSPLFKIIFLSFLSLPFFSELYSLGDDSAFFSTVGDTTDTKEELVEATATAINVIDSTTTEDPDSSCNPPGRPEAENKPSEDAPSESSSNQNLESSAGTQVQNNPTEDIPPDTASAESLAADESLAANPQSPTIKEDVPTSSEAEAKEILETSTAAAATSSSSTITAIATDENRGESQKNNESNPLNDGKDFTVKEQNESKESDMKGEDKGGFAVLQLQTLTCVFSVCFCV